MKKASLAAWQEEYDILRQQLAQIGYISQGSVVDRNRLKNPRSGYQWTRKLSQKTVTVALSQEQFKSLSKAIQNRRTMARTIRRMEQLSRKIIFASTHDTSRRKPLLARVLGTI
jgi:hypothetical protein